jgi:hypothetical protein
MVPGTAGRMDVMVDGRRVEVPALVQRVLHQAMFELHRNGGGEKNYAYMVGGPWDGDTGPTGLDDDPLPIEVFYHDAQSMWLPADAVDEPPVAGRYEPTGQVWTGVAVGHRCKTMIRVWRLEWVPAGREGR